jgi:geranylgeranylglycerol-phosphate geranylgeranyltransferase
MIERLTAYHDLVKSELPLAAGICVIAGQVLFLGDFASIKTTIIGFLVGFFLSGSAMISNDYFDREVDRINRPDRPLPSGRVTVNEVWSLAITFGVLGLLCAAYIGITPLVIALIVWLIGQAYNWKGKDSGLVGNMMVSSSVASTFIIGGISVGGITNGLVWTFAGLAFFFDLAEEILGGIMDVSGDAIRDSKSLIRTRGRDFALKSAGLAFLAFILVSFIPYLTGWMKSSYLVLICVVDLAIIFYYARLWKIHSPEEGRSIIRMLYMITTPFILVVVWMRIANV